MTSFHKRDLQRTHDSVALLETFDGANKPVATGSGFFVSGDGLLVTNFHVIKGATRVSAKLENGATYEVEGAVATNEDSDIALLRVKASGIPFLKLGDSDKAEVGQHVMVIGSPLGLEGTVSDGIISAKRELPGNGKLLQITAPIAHGSSGSPVLDADNHVLGVATLLLKEGQALNFAVPVEVPKILLAGVNPGTEVKSFETLILAERTKLLDDREYQEVQKLTGPDRESKDYIQALRLIESLEKRFPLGVELYVARAGAFFGLESYNDAIEPLEQALKLRPDSAELWFMLALPLERTGQIEQAIMAWERALAIKPNNPDWRRSLAENYNKLGIAYDHQAKFDKALAAFEEAAKINPDADYAWYNLGRVYFVKKEFGEAVGPLERAVQINPQRADTWVFLGFSREGLKHFGLAAEAFEHYTSLAPTDSVGWAGLGRCYWKLQRAHDSVEALWKAISIKPGDRDLWELLAVVYRDSGDTTNAVAAYQRYQALTSR